MYDFRGRDTQATSNEETARYWKLTNSLSEKSVFFSMLYSDYKMRASSCFIIAFADAKIWAEFDSGYIYAGAEINRC